MVTIAAAHFVSRSSRVNCHGNSGAEAKANSAQISLRNASITHNGLRAVNKLDALRSHAKATEEKVEREVSKARSDRLAAKIVCKKVMNLVFVASEVFPWSKTGGIADVLGALPPAMAARGHRVMTVSPRYDQYEDGWDTSVLVEIKVGDRIETVRFFHCYKRGVDLVFVDHPTFLEKVWGKTGSKLYGPRAELYYEDNLLRFSLLCQAALEAPRVLNLNNSKNFAGPYGEDVIFIANDWHTALLPCYLKATYQSRGLYKNAKVAFCIQNMSYQGRYAASDFSLLNLPKEYKSSLDFIDGKINSLKAGILESHLVLTVSPYYAKELVSCAAKGVGLWDVVRRTGITGIVNGMDVREWNPVTDKHIDINYDETTVMDAKPLLKEALQAAVGLPVDRNIPLIGFIGRLVEQKGSDILAAAIPKFIGENVQVVVLGAGNKTMERQIEALEIEYPSNARGVVKFNDPLAHMITAGADFMLVPSRFEPCGLVQLQAMRYGTVPIVASTGGLVDTVEDGFTGFQMGGFSVDCEAVDPADVEAVARTVKKALATYGTAAMEEMIGNCMSRDLSWKEPARLWEKVLLSLEVAGGEAGAEGEEEIAPLARENIATGSKTFKSTT